MFDRSPKKVLLQLAAAAGMLVAAHAAHAGVPVVPVLIKQAVFSSSRLKTQVHAQKTLSLAIPDDIVAEARTSSRAQLLPSELEAAPDESGMYFGPNFIDPSHAPQVRAMVKTMPDPAKKILTAPVGPWAMSGVTPIGSSWSVGPALYTRF